MRLIGFNFTKISVEKLSDKFENLKISTNIDIKNVSHIKKNMIQPKDELIEIKFNYNIYYSPKIATISFSGNTLLMVDQKTAKEFVKEWKKKRIPENNKTMIFNVILRKSNIKAFQLEDEVNLPLHLPLPTIKGFEKAK